MVAYMVAVCNITNLTPELKQYAQRSSALSKKCGGKYLVRGNPVESHEGDILEGKSVIVAEFPDMAALESFIKSDEYQNEIKPLREGTGEYHIGFYESPPEDQQ